MIVQNVAMVGNFRGYRRSCSIVMAFIKDLRNKYSIGKVKIKPLLGIANTRALKLFPPLLLAILLSAMTSLKADTPIINVAMSQLLAGQRAIESTK